MAAISVSEEAHQGPGANEASTPGRLGRLRWTVAVTLSALVVAIGIAATAITAGPGPATHLLDVVPASAIGYLELDSRGLVAGPTPPPPGRSTPGSPAGRLLAALAAVSDDGVLVLPPGAQRLLSAVVANPTGGAPAGFSGTAAVAFLPGGSFTPGETRAILLLGVRDPGAARTQLLSLAGSASEVSWGGRGVLVGDTYAAVMAGSSMVVGAPEGIVAFLRDEAGPSLAENPRLRTALAALPGDHLALGWFDLSPPSSAETPAAVVPSATAPGGPPWLGVRLFAVPIGWGLEVVWPWAAGPDLALRRDHLTELLPVTTLLLIDLPAANSTVARAVASRWALLPVDLVPAELGDLLASLPGAVGNETGVEEWGLAVVEDGEGPLAGIVARAADPAGAELAVATIRRVLAVPSARGEPSLEVAAVGRLVVVTSQPRLVDVLARGGAGPRLADDRGAALLAADVGTTNEAFLWIDLARLRRGAGSEVADRLVRSLVDGDLANLPAGLARNLGRLAADGASLAASWVPNSELSRLRLRVLAPSEDGG
jgi:hypothetical protein